jgi:hypothetical protein
VKNLLRKRMADEHETDLARRLGGRKTRGSGNQAANPMDGRHQHYSSPLTFAWDGKSTLGGSIGVTREMWDKAVDQAHSERPMLALRFYDTERLAVGLDLVVISLDDFEELLEAVRVTPTP